MINLSHNVFDLKKLSSSNAFNCDRLDILQLHEMDISRSFKPN